VVVVAIGSVGKDLILVDPKDKGGRLIFLLLEVYYKTSCVHYAANFFEFCW